MPNLKVVDACVQMAKSGAEIADFQDRMELGMEFVISNADHDDAEVDEEVDRVEAAFRDAHHLASFAPVPEAAVARSLVRRGEKVSITEHQPQSQAQVQAQSQPKPEPEPDDKKHE